MLSYRTCARPAEYTLVEKRSKFIANCFPVLTEEEARIHLEDIRRRYPDARHIVYAYLTEGDTNYQRYSDDGEPQGTGGLPVLEAIKRAGITNCLVTVTRYFGGILLGAPGLTRAYGQSAAGALEEAGVKTVAQMLSCSVTVPFGSAKSVSRALTEKGFPVTGTDYSQDVTYHAACPPERQEELKTLVDDLTSGVNIFEEGGMIWIPS